MSGEYRKYRTGFALLTSIEVETDMTDVKEIAQYSFDKFFEEIVGALDFDSVFYNVLDTENHKDLGWGEIEF